MGALSCDEREYKEEYIYCEYILRRLEYGDDFVVANDMHKKVIKEAITLYKNERIPRIYETTYRSH